MSFDTQVEKLKQMVVNAFGNQFGYKTTTDDWDLKFSRLNDGEVVAIQMTTKRTDDNVRIHFKASDYLAKDSGVGVFHLQVKPNYPAGTLYNETYVSYGSLAVAEYPAIYAYVNSPEFQEYQNSKPRLKTMANKTLCYTNGHPLETQR